MVGTMHSANVETYMLASAQFCAAGFRCSTSMKEDITMSCAQFAVIARKHDRDMKYWGVVGVD